MNESKLILLVEDDERLNAVNRRALNLAGYSVMAAGNLSEAREHLKAHTPNIIILDIKLPDGNGADFCREIREIMAAPILFLTSVRERGDVLEGLNAGGDDYLIKPFDLDMMLAKVASFLRRDGIVSRIRPASSIIRGPLTMDLLSGRAYLNGEDMLLTQKEFAVLLLLAQNDGKILTKEQIYSEVWKAPINDDANSLRRHISSIKSRLDESEGKVSLTTVRGEGYMLEIEK